MLLPCCSPHADTTLLRRQDAADQVQGSEWLAIYRSADFANRIIPYAAKQVLYDAHKRPTVKDLAALIRLSGHDKKWSSCRNRDRALAEVKAMVEKGTYGFVNRIDVTKCPRHSMMGAPPGAVEGAPQVRHKCSMACVEAHQGMSVPWL